MTTELDTPAPAASKTFSRRQVAVAAAWAMPVLAVAVAAPTVSASPIICPTAIIIGTFCLTKEHHVRTIALSGGAIAYNDLGSGITTGELTIRFTSVSDEPYVLKYDETQFGALGWTKVAGGTPSDVSFTHAELSGTDSIPLPGISWVGSGPVEVRVSLTVANTDAGIVIQGLSQSY